MYMYSFQSNNAVKFFRNMLENSKSLIDCDECTFCLTIIWLEILASL